MTLMMSNSAIDLISVQCLYSSLYVIFHDPIFKLPRGHKGNISFFIAFTSKLFC